MSNVKKLVTIMLLVILMVMVLPFSFSKAETKATFSVTSAEGKVGDTVTVYLKVDKAFTASGLNISLKFDKEKLKVKNITKGNLGDLYPVITKVDSANNGGEIVVTGINSDNEDITVPAGTLLTIQFEILNGAKGKIDIENTVKEVLMANNENKVGDFAATNGSITVNVPVEEITLDKSTLNLQMGGTTTGQLKATVTPSLSELYPSKDIIWMTDSNKVATVTKSGDDTATVTAVGNGETKITATIGGKFAICTVKVTTPLQNIELDKTEVTLLKGQSDKLSYTFVPATVFPVPNVTWKSDAPEVVSVDNGVIKALGNDGEKANITVTADGKTATCVVTVKEIPLNSIAINKADFNLNLGDSVTLGVLYDPENTTDTLGKVKWTSDKPDVVKVDQNGKVTAVGVGVAEITAEVNGKTANVTITVPEINITGVKLIAEKTAIKVDGTTKLSFKTIPEKVTDKITEVKYISEDEEIATVDENGVVTGRKPGKVKIKVIVNGEFEDEIEIEVVEKTAVLPDEDDNTTNETTGGSSTTTPTNQTGNTTTTTNTNTETNPDLPKTGDMPIVLFVILVVGSLTGIVLVVRKKLKK